MRIQQIITVTLVVFALASPGTSAASTVSLAAPAMAAEGDVVSTGGATMVEFRQGTTDVPNTWYLHAESLRVEVEYHEADSPVQGVSVQETDSGRTEEHHDQSMITPLEPGNSMRFWLATPDAVSTITSPEVQWEYKSSVTVEESGMMEPSQPERITIGDGMQPAFRSGQIDIRGDLIIMAWDWDLRINSTSGTSIVETGYDREPYAPGAPPEGPGKASTRQAYLYAQNATFSVQVDHRDSVRVLQQLQSVDVLGSLRFERPSQLQGLDAANPNEVVFQGQSRAVTTGTGQGTQSFRLDGDWNAVSATGQSVGVIAPTGGGTAWWPYLLTIGLVIPASISTFAGRRTWLRNQLDELEADLDLGQYEQAVQRATKLLKSRLTRADAALLKAVALLRLERFDDVQDFLERPWPGPMASWHYLKATVEASSGDAAVAREHLDKCLADAPEFAIEVQGNPMLLDLLRQRDDGLEGYH